MNTYAPIRRKIWPGSHPGLGAFLGFILLVFTVSHALGYGLMGLGAILLAAGALAGAVAHGGARVGVGAGARAAVLFMLLLLVSWAIVLLQEQGVVELASTPEVAQFMPYVLLMESLWERIDLLLTPLIQNFATFTGGDLLIDLLLKVILPAAPAAFGGAITGAVVGRPEPRPLPVSVNPHYGPYPAYPQYPPAPTPSPPPELAYLCPWCGLKVLPHMEKCWNCGGPLKLPPPPPY